MTDLEQALQARLLDAQDPAYRDFQRRLIPTERFLEKIWGYDTDAEVHVVWVYISYLRKKLASLGATVQIRVARNAGYSLEEIP